MNILKNKKITKKGLGLLLLALFAGNADAAQVRSVIDTYNSIKGISKIRSITALLKLTRDDNMCEKIVNTASNSHQLTPLIHNLVNTINYDKYKYNRENAAEILRKIIFSKPNSAGRRNHQLHASLHFAENKSNTFNALELDTGEEKELHTVLKNYYYGQVFGKVLQKLTDEETTISFNGNQIKIDMPLNYVCNNPTIYEVNNREFVYGLDAIKQYMMHCCINIDNKGIIKGRRDNTPTKRDADGNSGSCYPIAK